MDKTYILNEIRRTAATNKGVPLGWRKFSEETGIDKSQWTGKLWARWGDAVREAGFTPNKMTESYSESFLIERIVVLTRELGRIPVYDEIRLKASTDPDFPDAKTFRFRFGTKAQLVSKVAAYCHGQSGCEDILALCHEVLSRATPVGVKEKDNEILGFVYLIKSGRFYKIGKSNAVGRRERELAIQLPERANTVHVIRTDDPDGIEFYWHRRFAAKRRNGEWFDLNASEIKAFKKRKFM